MTTITASVIIRNLRNSGSSVLRREAPVPPPSPPTSEGAVGPSSRASRRSIAVFAISQPT